MVSGCCGICGIVPQEINIVNIEDEPEKYKVDLGETFYANSFKMCFSLAGMFILVMYIGIFQKMIDQFQLPEMQVIAIFVFAYSTIKWIFAVMPDISVVYKIRDEYARQEPANR